MTRPTSKPAEDQLRGSCDLPLGHPCPQLFRGLDSFTGAGSRRGLDPQAALLPRPPQHVWTPVLALDLDSNLWGSHPPRRIQQSQENRSSTSNHSIDFAHGPGVTGPPSLSTDPLGSHGPKLRNPFPNHFMSNEFLPACYIHRFPHKCPYRRESPCHAWLSCSPAPG